MIEFIQQYGAALLGPFVLIGWIFVFKKKTTYTNFTIFTLKYFIGFFLIFIIWNILAFSFSSNVPVARLIFLLFWIIISIYEFYYILKALFLSFNAETKHNDIFVITLSVLAIPVILAAILCHTNKTYNPVNTTDFYNMILLMLGTMIVLKNLLSFDSFMEDIESFFIYSGFVLYFGLHILASNVIPFGFRQNWFFAQYASLISLIYWLGSVYFIWKIRSRLSS
ncbi:MAG: hypothetical protein ISS80_04910 [Candidatus Cloacimonetes bacterium]|nr:hypothetical protein [Candidatus Cloacimonadota bacterium]